MDSGHVSLALGIERCVQLAEQSGFYMDGRNRLVVVNEWMMTEPDAFAARYVASLHDLAMSRKRYKQWDHALVTGGVAVKNMDTPSTTPLISPCRRAGATAPAEIMTEATTVKAALGPHQKRWRNSQWAMAAFQGVETNGFIKDPICYQNSMHKHHTRTDVSYDTCSFMTLRSVQNQSH